MMLLPSIPTMVWGGNIRLIGRGLGLEIDEITEEVERLPLEESVDTVMGRFEKGTQGAFWLKVIGKVGRARARSSSTTSPGSTRHVRQTGRNPMSSSGCGQSGAQDGWMRVMWSMTIRSRPPDLADHLEPERALGALLEPTHHGVDRLFERQPLDLLGDLVDLQAQAAAISRMLPPHTIVGIGRQQHHRTDPRPWAVRTRTTP